MLQHAGWITGSEYETGLMFRDLWKHADRHYVALRNEIMVDLMKVEALDLVCRVCRDGDADNLAKRNAAVRLASDRMPDLRQGLNLVALRFRQIEQAAAELPSPRRHAGRAAKTSVVADTPTA
jgi:hypothetical protein